MPCQAARRSARCARSAASEPISHGTMTENVSVAGSRPASSHARSHTARRSAHSAGRGVDGVVLVGELRRHARGAGLRASADDERRVRALHRLRQDIDGGEAVVLAVEARTARRPRRRARPRAAPRASPCARRAAGTAKPKAVCSASCQPAPRPSSTRPPEMWSIAVTVLASTDGWRNVAGETSTPRRRRVVTAARPASVVQVSSDPRSS